MSERVVLGRAMPDTFVGFQWSGAEPEGMHLAEQAVTLGAMWEADELVTYDLDGMRRRFESLSDDWVPDSD